MNNPNIDVSEAELALDATLTALLRRMISGDEQALSELYQTTVSRIYGLALTITGRVSDAEEVTSDVYWSAWENASRYDAARGSALAWLMIMTRSRALDKRRRNKAQRQSLSDDLALETLLDQTPSADQHIAYDQQRQAIQKALACLSDDQRQLILLAYFRGLSHRELADTLSMPLGTVKSHIRRGLALLKEVLAPMSIH